MNLDLSRRERDVLVLAAHGLTIPRIAERLGLAESTVKNHMSSAYKRLRVDNRFAAFLELGWLTPPDGDID